MARMKPKKIGWKEILSAVHAYRSITLLLSILLAALTSLASAAEPAVLSNATYEIILSQQHITYSIDTKDQWDIENVLNNQAMPFQPLQQKVLNLGHTTHAVWVHFQLQPEPQLLADTRWILELEYPLLERVDIFVVENKTITEQYRLGYSLPMNARLLPHRFFVQPIKVEPGKTYDIYMNVKRENGNVQMPMKISRLSRFYLNELTDNYLYGILFGIIISMIIYNSFLAISVGNKAYYYYILYLACSFVLFQSLTGYGFLFIWHDMPQINGSIVQISTSCAIISVILFFKNFTNINHYYPKANPAIYAMIAVGVILVALKLSTSYFLSSATSIYGGITSIAIPIIAYLCWRKGSRFAGFFLIAWSFLIFGTLLFIAQILGFLPSNSLTNNALLAGSVTEMLLLSFGLADLINSEKKGKYRALEEQHQAVVRLKDAEDRLMHRALHSRTTGLPNRTLLRKKLEFMLNRDEATPFALILLSFNNFHEFNKTLGHTNGDAILYGLSQRLSHLAKDIKNIVIIEQSDNQIYHVAGVEGITYAMLILEPDQKTLSSITLQILSELERPYEHQGLALNIEATTGIAFFPEHGTDGDNLLRNAHIALEAAATHSDKLAIYSQDIDPYSARRISLLGDLRNAIENNSLDMYFQPQISLATNEVYGAEALIRWVHPEYGFVPPDEFIPLAERTGVINPLTFWICNKVFEFKKTLDDKGFDLNISINISARNLQEPNFKDRICELAKNTGIALDKITMELTETAVMYDPDDALRVMRELSDVGIRLSIDDFGTGYSSLSYLKKLPVDELKIDRSFVMDMASNIDDQMIVQTTLTMGHNLKLNVVAEGIEDQSTLDTLKNMKCDYAQGYHIARPMPMADFVNWLKQYNQQSSAIIAPIAKS